jgi:hypothetical protein
VKTSVRIVGFPAEIQNGHLLKLSQFARQKERIRMLLNPFSVLLFYNKHNIGFKFRNIMVLL